MMPRFSRNTRLWCLTILMFSAFMVNALTLNPLVEAPDGHRMLDQQPLLFNNQIIFVTEMDDEFILWAYDLSNNSYTLLQTFENYFYPKFYVIDNYFYFKDDFFTYLPQYNRLWKSDGTSLGTKIVGGAALHKTPIYKKGNLIFARSALNTKILTVFDGQVLENYLRDTTTDFDKPMANLACGFGVRDFVYPVYLFYSDQMSLVRYQYNETVDYSESLPLSFELDEDRVWYFENTCFYHIIGQQYNDILVIPEQGEHFFLGETINYEEVSYIAYFKDHYYAIVIGDNGNSQILKLSLDLSTIEKHVELSSTLYFSSLSVSDQYLIALADTGPLASPTVSKQTYFDENLNIIEGLGSINPLVPKVYATENGETVVFSDYINSINLKTLTTDITNPSRGLVLNGNAIKHIIANKNSPESFVLKQNLDSGIYQICSLDHLPDIGSLSVGNWFDPDYQSQGVSIVEGERDDGSRYLFVTLYLFQDGEPLWLAGTSNISYPQPALDIELGAYSGPGLWQADTPASVEKFADMTLSMSSCHRMMLAMETEDGQSFNLELQRMVNKNIDHLCQD